MVHPPATTMPLNDDASRAEQSASMPPLKRLADSSPTHLTMSGLGVQARVQEALGIPPTRDLQEVLMSETLQLPGQTITTGTISFHIQLRMWVDLMTSPNERMGCA